MDEVQKVFGLKPSVFVILDGVGCHVVLDFVILPAEFSIGRYLGVCGILSSDEGMRSPTPA
jgi:hypothetical protein